MRTTTHFCAKPSQNWLASFEEYAVLFEADNGKEIKKKINEHLVPDLVLLDVNMPEMDGFETAAWLNKNYPENKSAGPFHV